MEGRQKRLPTIFSYNCSAIEFLLVFSLSIFREISVLDLLCFTVYLSLIFLPVYIRDGKRMTNQKPHAQIKTTHTFKPRGLIFVLNKLKLDPEVFIQLPYPRNNTQQQTSAKMSPIPSRRKIPKRRRAFHKWCKV